jgi:hypothetical protein
MKSEPEKLHLIRAGISYNAFGGHERLDKCNLQGPSLFGDLRLDLVSNALGRHRRIPPHEAKPPSRAQLKSPLEPFITGLAAFQSARRSLSAQTALRSRHEVCSLPAVKRGSSYERVVSPRASSSALARIRSSKIP